MEKIILLDIDGTLFNDKKQMTSRTREALIKAEESGARLVLASGRTPNGLMDIAKDLEMDKHHGLLCAYNGSQVIDFESGEVLFNQPMSIEEGKAVLEHMKKFDVRPMIDKGDTMYVNDVFDCMVDRGNGEKFNVIQYESRGNKYLLAEKKDLAEFADFPINKILTAGDAGYLKEHWQEMAAPFEGKLACMFTAPFYFEYTAKGIDKSASLKKVLEDLGYTPADLIAFGDAQNDKTMIEYAGLGVAMGNAVDEVKAVANVVTDDNNHDGIAKVIETLLNEEK